MNATPDQDVRWMEYAIHLAKKAEAQGEVPVGAVLVRGDQVVGEGWNQVITQNDPTAHAEVVAIRDAGSRVGNYRVIETTLYVTLEPCLMCVGSLVHARIGRLVYGARDLKTGAVVSATQQLDAPFHNHHVKSQGGVLEERCSQMLSDFFRRRRAAQKADSAAPSN